MSILKFGTGLIIMGKYFWNEVCITMPFQFIKQKTANKTIIDLCKTVSPWEKEGFCAFDYCIFFLVALSLLLHCTVWMWLRGFDSGLFLPFDKKNRKGIDCIVFNVYYAKSIVLFTVDVIRGSFSLLSRWIVVFEMYSISSTYF